MFTKTDIEKYFTAEKSESLLFIIIGVAAIILALVFFFFLKTNFYKGIALPLLLVAVIQIAVGYTVYKRSDGDRKKNTYSYDMNPSELKSKEIPRMEKVMKNFVLFRWIEIALVVAGLLLVFLFRSNPERTFIYGLGIGLAIQALIMLGADYFAEARAKAYTKGLTEFTQKT
jgi:amino acid transporter